MKPLTIESFKEKSQLLHKNNYSYSSVIYKNVKTKVKIICPIHGEFMQVPMSHLKGSGCPSCGGVKAGKHRIINVKIFIENSNNIHDNKYDYTKTKIINSESRIIIVCPIHGEFKQRIHDHLKGSGCPNCGGVKKLDTDSFIQQSQIKHGDKYDYSVTKYCSYEIKVKIICPIHGEFKQTPHTHLKGSGCPSCNESKGEASIRLYLNENRVKFIRQYRFPNCKDVLSLPFDFYLPEYNICIEYDGRQHFEPIKRWGGITELKNIQRRDEIKTNYCLNNNIKLLRFKYTQKMKNIKEEILLELRSAEGGQDAKLLVDDMKNIYIKAAKNNNFN